MPTAQHQAAPHDSAQHGTSQGGPSQPHEDHDQDDETARPGPDRTAGSSSADTPPPAPHNGAPRTEHSVPGHETAPELDPDAPTRRPSTTSRSEESASTATTPERGLPGAPVITTGRTATTAVSRGTAAPDPGRSRWGRVGAALLLAPASVLLAIVMATPMALSSQDLMRWAAAPTGLGLTGHWPILVFIALDAAATSCVLLALFCAVRGEPAGVLGLLVWCFAGLSAFANWRNSSVPGAAPDAVWFFPAMSVIGPILLEAVLRLWRGIVQRRRGTRSKRTPRFGWQRWTPGLGSFRDTYGAYRTALLLNLETVHDAVRTYHQLCPTGSLRVVRALREQPLGWALRHAAETAAASLTSHPTSVTATLPGNGTNPQDSGLDRSATNPAAWPVDLMRRIPVQPEAYARWRAAWADLQQLPHHQPDTQPHEQAEGSHQQNDPSAADHPNATGREADAQQVHEVAARHQISHRQVQFVRRAGQAGLLDHPLPPAVWLAALAAQHLPAL